MKKFAAAALALIVLCAALNALGSGEKDGSKPQKVEVSGIVRLVGNSPMTSLVITGGNREWFIESGEQGKLMHLQQQMVTVRAKEYYYDRVFANGMSAGRHYYLKDITVISP
ncbi:MAG: hypothetical protein FWG46_02720 [Treponema sp.]|jgi:hypothetical protein|nr:hypothetical protein [Treponema sp.]